MNDLSPSARTGSIPTSTITTIGEETVLPGSDTTGIITFPDHNDWAINGDFTMEIFGAKFANNTALHGLISHYQATGNQRSWAWIFDGSVSPKVMRMYLSTDGTATPPNYEAIDSSSWTPTANTAYDICVERSSNDLRFYVNGVMLNKTTLTVGAALFNSSQRLEIGLGFQKTSNPWNGRFKAIRITKAARYANDTGYSVPSLPLPTSA